jgi:serine/threonine protein kinase/Flp pilus assembly protein TadD
MNRPTAATTRIHDWSQADVDAIVDAFEEQQRAGEATLADFLPASTDPGYREVAVELIRVDLECSHARGDAKRLEDYRDIAPLIFNDPQALSDIAYEEYRLRKQAGEPVDISEYTHRFSLDTSRWPVWHGSSANSISRRNGPDGADGLASIGLRFPNVGEQFAGFDLVELLGRGAFGIVFRARQYDLSEREVVLKITAPRSVEPQRLARLQQTNIVPIYSVHQDAGLLGICMPFLGRRTLADLLRSDRPEVADQARLSTLADREKETVRRVPAISQDSTQEDGKVARDRVAQRPESPLAIEAVIDIIAQLAEGLAHAHGRGIVHSDLKPANVLVGDEGTPLLVDFNLAGDAAATDRETLLVGGTLAYMSPEHLQATLDGGQASPASDIYSLGVIFFELLTGRRPFPSRDGSFDETALAMIVDRQQGGQAVRALGPGISPAIGSIVARCLAPNRNDRYHRASQLAEDLRRHQADLPLRYAAEPSLRERGGKWLRRHAHGVRAAAIIALIGLLAVTAAMYEVRRGRLLDLEAAAAYSEFETDVLTASLCMNTPKLEPELNQIGRAAANSALAGFDLGDEKHPVNNSIWSRLTPAERATVEQQAMKMKYALATSMSERQKLTAGQESSSDLGKYLHGIEFSENRNYGAAAQTFESLLRQDPQDATLWLLLGNAYAGAHRLADAEACYTAVIALQPKAIAGYFYRGECRFDQGHFADAEQDFNSVLELRPGMPAGLLNRALVWRAMGAFPQAERDATAAIDGGVQDPRAFFVRALIRDALGNSEGACADRERGFELQPVDDKGWVARGIAHLRDNPQLAGDDFEAGLREFPTAPALLQNLVHVYGDRLNQPEVALEKANRLVELYSADPAALASRAVLHARLGDRDAARRDAEHAARSDPPPLTSLQLACAYALTSRSQMADATDSVDALRQLQRALSRDPQLANRAATDPDLESIRSRPEFKVLMVAAQQLTNSLKPVPTESADADAIPTSSGDNR